MITQSQPSRPIWRTHSMIRPRRHVPPIRTHTAACRGAVRSSFQAMPGPARRASGTGLLTMPSMRTCVRKVECCLSPSVARCLAGVSRGLVRDTSGHVKLAVRTVNDPCRWPCGAGAQADRVWQGPGPGTDQDYCDAHQTVPELLTRFGSDG